MLAEPQGLALIGPMPEEGPESSISGWLGRYDLR